ncbi:metalloprotease PmbA [Candidatus Erwinia haradaeae]|uniref:Metalloprotease PmbA n=1 Tax=Candidatus Erwinia haradaeae TaxID=1922217 RepID=A0A803FU17_9GAMM|nr:metalloprotease PmbA [Candidatus Erwinia haradaeae]VFP88445.1 Metalloprotease PmbA [Candidatus Erwinia haradaeae]
MKVLSKIIEKSHILEKAVETALNLAEAHRSLAEVTVIQSSGISISTSYGVIENIQFHSDTSLWITAYYQQHQGSASSTDFSQTAIKKTMEAALGFAQYTSLDPCSGIADHSLMAFNSPDLDLYYPENMNIDLYINLASSAEKAALQMDSRITKTGGGSFDSRIGIKVFGNSHGMIQSYGFTQYAVSSCVIAEANGKMERDNFYSIARSIKDLQRPEEIGAECGRRVLSRLSPRKLRTMKVPVIFLAEVATELFEHLAVAINGRNVDQKSTFLLDALGEQIFPKWLSIKEDPHILKGLASAPFDNEGVQTNKTEIVTNGVLQQWLLNSYTGRKLGLESNGHAGGIYTWFVCGKKYSFNNILTQLGTGLLVTKFLGQGFNKITGDYSRGVSGFWVKHGIIQYPVSEITISGNLRDIWKNIVSMGEDIEKRGKIQCGSILISEIQVAGY